MSSTRARALALTTAAPSIAGLAMVGLATVGVASPAAAYDRQVGLWVGAGYAGITGDTTLAPHAVATAIGVGIGLGDVWELRVRVDQAHHFSTTNRVSGSVDLVYLVDVLSVVPYVGIGLGGAFAHLAPEAGTELRGDLLVGAVLGFDVLLGREWTVGVEIRPTFVPTDFAREPMLLTALARAQFLLEM